MPSCNASTTPTPAQASSKDSTELSRQFSDAPALLAAYNPDRQVDFAADPQRCHFGRAPSIRTVALAFGAGVAESWLIIQLNNLSEWAGVRRKLLDPDEAQESTTRITELARRFIALYPSWRLTEYMLFFHRFKNARYGRFYGIVDPMIILEAAKIFNLESRTEYARHELQLEADKAQRHSDALSRLRESYGNRVPGAFTADAPLSFLQYQLLELDSLSCDELSDFISRIKSNQITIPTNAKDLLIWIQSQSPSQP